MRTTHNNIESVKFKPAILEAILPILQNTLWLLNDNLKTEALAELYELSDRSIEWNLIKHLINKFTYVDEIKFNDLKQNIAEQIIAWRKTDNLYVLAAISDEDDADGSQALLQSLKNAAPLIGVFDKNEYINSITGAVRYLDAQSKPFKTRRNIILIDDFIGTGKTIKGKLEWLNQALISMGLREQVGVKLCSLAHMEKSLEVIHELKASGLLSDFYSPLLLKRGITDYIIEPDLSLYYKAMDSLEKKLGGKNPQVRSKTLLLKDFNWGYKKSETIYSWSDNNIPNNVFPIFWWPIDVSNKKRLTLFRRI